MPARSLAVTLLFLGLISLSGCKSDFDVNEPWKEIDIIYGLLDVNDSIQYIKINKAFLNENEDVYKLAGIEDSLYHQDSLLVTLQPLKNGVPQGSPVALQKTYNTNKDTGIFASPGQYLYAAPKGFAPDPDMVYELVAKNTVTGVTATSQTPVAKNAILENPAPGSNPTFSFKNDPASKLNIDFFSGKGARFYDLTITFHYDEYRKSDSVKIKSDSISWPVFSNLYSNPDFPTRLKYVVNGTDFFRFVKQSLKIDGDVYRKIPSKPFTYKLTGGGAEIYNYMSVNRPSIGIVQKKPEYTNINNGYGIFSTRSRQQLRLNASAPLLGDLKKLDGYNFVD